MLHFQFSLQFDLKMTVAIILRLYFIGILIIIAYMVNHSNLKFNVESSNYLDTNKNSKLKHWITFMVNDKVFF